MSVERKIEVLEAIITETKDDFFKSFSRPFNGAVMAEYNANLGAAIVALAEIIKSELLPAVCSCKTPMGENCEVCKPNGVWAKNRIYKEGS